LRWKRPGVEAGPALPERRGAYTGRDSHQTPGQAAQTEILSGLRAGEIIVIVHPSNAAENARPTRHARARQAAVSVFPIAAIWLEPAEE
jgi:hypothetical protein